MAKTSLAEHKEDNAFSKKKIHKMKLALPNARGMQEM